MNVGSELHVQEWGHQERDQHIHVMVTKCEALICLFSTLPDKVITKPARDAEN